MYIFLRPGLASCRCRPLSSNVRLQKHSSARLPQEVRLSAGTEQPRRGQAADFSARRCAVVSRGQSRRKSKQPDFSQGRRERRPVQMHKEAARGGNRQQSTASIRCGLAPASEKGNLLRSSIVASYKQTKFLVHGFGLRCKAQGAMQSS